jgi:hypothetical protein
MGAEACPWSARFGAGECCCQLPCRYGTPEDWVACEECGGLGWVRVATIHRPQPHRTLCNACLGVGRLPPEKARWRDIGRAHREARVARKESLGEAAVRLCIPPQQLNDIEHGRADPTALGAPPAKAATETRRHG